MYRLSCIQSESKPHKQTNQTQLPLLMYLTCMIVHIWWVSLNLMPQLNHQQIIIPLYNYYIVVPSSMLPSSSRTPIDPSLISPSFFITPLHQQRDQPPSIELEQAVERHPYTPNKKTPQDVTTKNSSRSEKKRVAGLLLRQKKKEYEMELEASVREMSEQIQRCEQQIAKSKDELVEALRDNNKSHSEHAYTYEQLERCVTNEDPNIDQINLLMDLLQSRIGANSKERKAKLDYNFKELINSILPALYRYFLLSARRKQDCFKDDPTHESMRQLGLPWMVEMFDSLGLSSEQIKGISGVGEKLRGKEEETRSHIDRLQRVKQEMKQQSQEFDGMTDSLRSQIGPVLSAQLVIFSQRNKLRPECSLEHCLSGEPRKRIKHESRR